MKKPIIYTLMAAFAGFSCLPAQAGYYQTIYVPDEKPTVVVQQVTKTEPIVIEKHVQTSSYTDAGLAALGLTALVGGVILGVAGHDHHKKHHKAPPKPKAHGPMKGGGHHHPKR